MFQNLPLHRPPPPAPQFLGCPDPMEGLLLDAHGGMEGLHVLWLVLACCRRQLPDHTADQSLCKLQHTTSTRVCRPPLAYVHILARALSVRDPFPRMTSPVLISPYECTFLSDSQDAVNCSPCLFHSPLRHYMFPFIANCNIKAKTWIWCGYQR